MLKRLKAKVWQFLHSAMKAAIEEALEKDSTNMQRQFCACRGTSPRVTGSRKSGWKRSIRIVMR